MKKKLQLTLLLIFSLSTSAIAEHKIVYLISAPRSLSTAFLRMMESHGSFAVFNEPTEWAFDSIAFPKMAETFFGESGAQAFQSFDEVKKQIFKEVQYRNVFVKEMSYVSESLITPDIEFVQNPQVHFLFLVRNPHGTAMSFYKRDSSDMNALAYYIDMEKLHNVYQKISELSPNPVGIIFAEDLTESPETITQNLFKHLGIPFSTSALEWAQHTDMKQGTSQWHEVPAIPQIDHWHGVALRSKGFKPITKYETDTMGNPTFEEVEDPEHRSFLLSTYAKNKPFHEKFLQEHSAHISG